MILRGKVLKKIKDSQRVTLEKLNAIMLKTHRGMVTIDEFLAHYDELNENTSQQADNPQSTLAPPQRTPLGKDDIGQQNQNNQQLKPQIPVPKEVSPKEKYQDNSSSDLGEHASNLEQEGKSQSMAASDTVSGVQHQNGNQPDAARATSDAASDPENAPSTTSPRSSADNYAARLRERFQKRKQ